MKQHIVKAEILWSRSCSLQCSYCNMANGREHSGSLEEWKEGFDNLKNLGCSFSAFYGAEPLIDFADLPEIIEYSEKLGIKTTVITSGVTTHLSDKLPVLYRHGLRSITTSYDHNIDDRYSIEKTSRSLEVINKFRALGPVRDVAVVVTLTKKNFRYLPQIIANMTHAGIWTFFDLIHKDRGQPGSKVKDSKETKDLYFTTEDLPALVRILNEALTMKNQGYMFHASKTFLETLKLVVSLQMQLVGGSPYMWNCSDYDCFPSWVTVDCDGAVFPCDDFQVREGDIPLLKFWDLERYWEFFSNQWKELVKMRCPGCLWNTHIDAHLIKRGLLPLTDYIHGTEVKK